MYTLGGLKIAGVDVINLSKSFLVGQKKHVVLKNIHTVIPPNQITVILGKSGCGKTTFLRILANLEEADEGEIVFKHEEKIGYVFQEPRLMPWLNTIKNITFGIDSTQINPDKIQELISMVGLTGFEKAYPEQLSGGMKHRVALARALAHDSSLILMDEPFAALDYFTRETMQNELITIYESHQKTIIFVTHSIEEALAIGQNILVFNQGAIHAQFDLSTFTYPRDVLSTPLIDLKKKILEKLQ